MSFIDSIKTIVSLLNKDEKKKLVVVIISAIFIAGIEMIGVGSIMPFMTVAANPKMIHENPLLQRFFALLRFTNEKHFMVFLGLMVLFFLVLSNICQALMHYIKIKFTAMRRHSLSQRLLERYLGQDYVFFLNRNSHEFVKNINTEIQQMISVTMMQFVEFISRSIQIIILVTFLFLVNPFSTLGIAIAIMGIYSLIFIFSKRKLNQLGKQRFTCTSEEARIVSEAFWGIKEVKIAGCEHQFVDQYNYYSRRRAKIEIINEIIGDIPKFALETIAFSSIMIFVLFSLVVSGDFNSIAGTVTLYAYAGYRMIPSVQGLFKSLTKMKYGIPSSKRIVAEFGLQLKQLIPNSNVSELISLNKELKIDGLFFRYLNAKNDVLRDLSLCIKANTLIGFSGKTGSGKTTLIDVILGLLSPSSGSLFADGVKISTDNIRQWQENVGYVPQSIYLSDNTINSNIAFGIPPSEIDLNRVITASKLAQIHDFVLSELPDQYETKIGERGVRLSGGQRQRIGIARALYRNPSLLIMDEATSALDNQTEKAVMESIDSLLGTRTIILIAHRLTTLQKCDMIFLIDNGKIRDQGSFNKLAARNPDFVLEGNK